jgi:tol-pal system protein YbgF
MFKTILRFVFTALLLTVWFARPAAAADTKSQLIQVQTQLQIMQDNMTQMKQAFDERMGVMRDMLTQQNASVNKMSDTIQTLQKTLGAQANDSSKTVDSLSGQVQSLHDAVDELKARLAKVSKQLDDIQAGQQNIPNPAGATPGAPSGPSGASNMPQAPPADVLYNTALSDFNGGKNDLAAQEFAQYLQVYGNTDLAGNAQFYLGEIDYRRQNFAAAIQDYNRVLDQYPGGNKGAAAQLKKGFALLEMGQKDAGVQELKSLVTRYPKSPEAIQAKDRLNKLGVAGAASGAASRPARPSPRHQ